MSLAYYNNKFKPLSETFIPVTDLIVQRGIGVFDSIRTYGRSPFALTDHINRLAGSAKMSGIAADDIIAKLPAIIHEGLKRPELPDEDMMVKAYITGGEINDRGHYPKPDFFVIFDDVHKITKEELTHGVALRKNMLERPFPEVKSTNYLMAYIPMMFAKSADDFESLYIVNGEITESAASNFFLVLDGKLVTAPVGRVLDGITRKVLLTLAKENDIPVEIRCPLESELAMADEAFITGSVKEVLPVIRIGDQVIGTGKPGPIAHRLLELYNANIGRWLEK